MTGIAVDPAVRSTRPTMTTHGCKSSSRGQSLATWDGSTGKIGARYRIPNDVAVGPDGSVYVSDEGNTSFSLRCQRGGCWQCRRFGDGTRPVHPALGSCSTRVGNLYVADYGTTASKSLPRTARFYRMGQKRSDFQANLQPDLPGSR